MNKPKFLFALREDIKGDKRFLPTKAEPLSTGYDVRAAMKNREPLIIKPGQYFKIPLGFRSYCPDGWYYQLHPRSSSFTKRMMHNLIGVIDESWEGETLFAGQYLPDVMALGKELKIEFGDKVGQLVPVERKEMDVIEVDNETCDDLYRERNASRRDGGFGSTGV